MKKTLLLFVVISVISFSDYFTEKAISRIKENLKEFNIEKHNEKDEDIHDYLNFYDLDIRDIEYNYGYVYSSGYKIALQMFRPENPKGTIYFFHGYLSHTGLNSRPIREFIKRGYIVMAVDLPGHGLSDGDKGDIGKFKYYGEMIKDVYDYARKSKEPHIAIGHSTGGSSIVEYMYNNKTKFDEVILVCPLIRSKVWKLSNFGMEIAGDWLRWVPRVFRNSSGDREYLDFQKKIDPIQIRKLPTNWTSELIKWNEIIQEYPKRDENILVIQGKKDYVVDWKYNVNFLKRKFANMKLELVKNGRHEILNDKKEIREKVYNLIFEYLENKEK